MSKNQKIKRNMEVIGADGGTVDRIEKGRIRFTKADSGEGRHKGHHHFIDLVLVADVEGQNVRLSGRGGHDGRRRVWRADLNLLFSTVPAIAKRHSIEPYHQDHLVGSDIFARYPIMHIADRGDPALQQILL